VEQAGKILIYLAGGAFLLMFLYQLFGHPTAVVSEFKAVSGFVVEESKVLEGR
jgi:hypothetical protein